MTPRVGAMGWGRRSVFERFCSFGPYVAIASVVTIVPNIALTSLLRWATGPQDLATADALAAATPVTPWDLVGVALIWPLVETAVLAAVATAALRDQRSKPALVATIALIGGGVLHAAAYGALAFVPSAWMFAVFTTAFVAWRERGLLRAFGAALIPHVANNALMLAFVVAKGHSDF